MYCRWTCEPFPQTLKKGPDLTYIPHSAMAALAGTQTPLNSSLLPYPEMPNSSLTWRPVVPTLYCLCKLFATAFFFKLLKYFYFRACQQGNKTIVKKLLDHGADGRYHPVTKYSPLYIACYHGHRDIVEMLLLQFPELIQVNVFFLYLPFVIV